MADAGCSVVLQVFGDFGEIALQPGGVQLDGLDGLLNGALGAGEVVCLEEVLDLEGLFFAGEVLGQVFYQTSKQEPALVLVQQDLAVVFEVGPG